MECKLVTRKTGGGLPVETVGLKFGLFSCCAKCTSSVFKRAPTLSNLKSLLLYIDQANDNSAAVDSTVKH